MTTELQLPAFKRSAYLMRSMEQEDLERFTDELLEALWELHGRGELPPEITRLLRNWLAHAHFVASPVVQQRLGEVVAAIAEDVDRGDQ